MGGKYKHVIDEEDGEKNEEEEEEEEVVVVEDDDDDDVYMYLANMHPNERHAYRAAVQASKASEWNQQQEEHFTPLSRVGDLSFFYDIGRGPPHHQQLATLGKWGDPFRHESSYERWDVQQVKMAGAMLVIGGPCC
ncbi:hypothetical protein CK203_041615 [Vitis vinifera]|uniref:Uncharacterized protein n=1 Tax=Vitis vinifera TaxID=29760 RepID=A0A438I7H6_VITVI|nr:hypothetical protein CK203_041615 [Vitis vinifera]